MSYRVHVFMVMLFLVIALGYQNCSEPIPKDSQVEETSTGDNTEDNEVLQRNKDIDILFVVNTSMYLRSGEAAISQNSIKFFLWELPQNVNYQIGILLAHGSSSEYTGKLYKRSSSEPAVLSSSKMHIDEISEKVRLRLVNNPSHKESDGGEAGLYSLNQLLIGTRQGQEFFRDNANLVVIFISDENDLCARYPVGDSRVPDKYGYEAAAFSRECVSPDVTAQTVYRQLTNLYPPHSLLIAGLIYTNPAIVPFNYYEHEVGYGYTDIIALNNGLAMDRALNDADTSLFRIGEAAFRKFGVSTTY